MKSSPFPSEVSKFAAFEKRISEELTLDQIDEIVDQILIEMSDKTREVGQKLLSQLSIKQQLLIDRQIAILEGNENPISKIDQLKYLLFFLSPEEIERQLDVIEMTLALYSEIDQRVIEAAKRELRLLRFRQDFPIVNDLFGEAPSDFTFQMKKIAREIEKSGSLASLISLNETQRKEILRSGSRT